MKNKDIEALDQFIEEFQTKFNQSAKFAQRVENHLENDEDQWAAIWEAKDDLDDELMFGNPGEDEKLTLASEFASVANAVFSTIELKANFPQSAQKLAKRSSALSDANINKLCQMLDV